MTKENKIIEIKCDGYFYNTTGSYAKPELKMYINSLIDNEMFILSNSGRWSHHGGKQLLAITDDIRISGSRFAYEGEIHPGAGYEPVIEDLTNTAIISIDGNIYNRGSKEGVDVIFRFVVEINDSHKVEINRYRTRLKEYNDKESADKNKANDIMSFVMS